MKVSHGGGSMGCETMAMDTVTMNVTELVVPDLMPLILTQM